MQLLDLKPAPRTPGTMAVLALLCLPYLASGVMKLAGFGAAVAEVAGLGLPMPTLVAALTIALQLGASAMVVSGRGSQAGALALAAFTLAATWLAHGFWRAVGADRVHQMNTFLEHMALCGAFVLVTLDDARRRAIRKISS